MCFTSAINLRPRLCNVSASVSDLLCCSHYASCKQARAVVDEGNAATLVQVCRPDARHPNECERGVPGVPPPERGLCHGGRQVDPGQWAAAERRLSAAACGGRILPAGLRSR